MKLKRLICLLFTLFFIGGSVTAADYSNATKADFTATETLDPFGIQGNGPVGAFLDFGTLRCPGYGSPANPLDGCPAGSAFHWFGIQWLAALDSSDARFRGDMTVEANLIWNAVGEGRTWTRYSVDVDGGGIWDGQCQGNRRAAVGYFVETLHCSGRGNGGIVGGQHTTFTITILQYPSPVINFVGNIEGTVIDPHSN